MSDSRPYQVVVAVPAAAVIAEDLPEAAAVVELITGPDERADRRPGGVIGALYGRAHG
ncbi:MAG: hypothetical protein OXG41_07275 [Acidimicrobiaceae bacterium]|nr:hypothetical protein [Acidimicrobiaceae bacterium]